MVKYGFQLTSSLEKRLFDIPKNPRDYECASMLKNEIFSFQLVGWMKGSLDDPQTMDCKLKIVSNIAPFIHVFSVGYVPSMLPAYGCTRCKDYISKQPGLYPDPLYPIHNDQFKLINGQSRSLWLAVEPNGELAGTYPITLQIYNDQNELLAEKCFTLEVIDALLPKLDIYNTGWFHGDCISVLHHVPMHSKAYFDLVERYLEVYTKFGHNTILTPVFTPPLDMDVGGDRPTNQLVKVFVNAGKFTFDFSNLQYWLDICQAHGIEYFEISHLFSQWGAKYSPKVMAQVNGETKRIFGWEKEALDKDYVDFLNVFLPELAAFLKKAGVMERCLFHISDEPLKDHRRSYGAAKKIVTQHIPEDQLIDALGLYSLYKSGTVKRPVVYLDHVDKFLKHGAENLWAYHCCCQGEKVANRFMAMPSHRNRVLGVQLYKNKIKGFLQWGFNFWFSVRSRRVIDPYHNTDADMAFPSGDSFLVYPLDKNGNLICSLRLYVFNEAMQDHRAMKLLESLAGREAVCALLDDIQGFDKYPRNGEYYLALREKINQAIMENSCV